MHMGIKSTVIMTSLKEIEIRKSDIFYKIIIVLMLWD